MTQRNQQAPSNEQTINQSKEETIKQSIKQTSNNQNKQPAKKENEQTPKKKPYTKIIQLPIDRSRRLLC